MKGGDMKKINVITAVFLLVGCATAEADVIPKSSIPSLPVAEEIKSAATVEIDYNSYPVHIDRKSVV